MMRLIDENTPQHLLPKVRSKAIMRFPEGATQCEARVSSLYPGHKCSENGTLVGCHIDGAGKGQSTKETDISILAGCFNCHAIIDGVDIARRSYIIQKYPAAYADRLMRGMIATQTRMIAKGIIVIPDARWVG